MNRIFVGNLNWKMGDQELRDAFVNFGTVKDAKVITDKETGRSRGFGFVEFETADEANEAINGMDGKELEGRQVNVNLAQERKRDSGGGGGGGTRRGKRR